MPQKLSFPSRAPARREDKPRAFVDTTGASIDIYGEIGLWGVTAADVLGRLREIPPEGAINLRINSGGGDVFEAIAIYNDLMAHPAKVTATITGVAASAASLICMAADKIAMMPASRLMIHQAWCYAQGNADTFEGLVRDLRSVDASMADAYAARCGKPASDIAAMMAATTWLSADEALAMKLCDRIEGEMKKAPEADPEPTAAATDRPRAARRNPKFVQREPLSVEMVATLERLADRSKEIGYARNA